MALDPEFGSSSQVFIPEAAPVSIAPEQSTAHLIFDADDPRLNEMSREERIRQYYARELAFGNIDALAPRYRASESEYEANNPWADTLAADPLSDPQVAEIASQLRIALKGRELSKALSEE